MCSPHRTDKKAPEPSFWDWQPVLLVIIKRFLPSAGTHFPELGNGGRMRVQAAIHSDDLATDIRAFVRAEIDAGMSDIFRAAVAVDHDIAQEDIL